jgi:polyisoprenoid-binding protein YceI
MMVLLSAAVAVVLGADGTVLQLDASNKRSTVSYSVTHKFHKVTGVTHDVQGAAKILADGTAQIQVRAPVVSFDSDNGNRDSHMKETVEAAKFPDVTVKCLAKLSGTTSQKATADCDVNLHGVSQKVSVPVELTFDNPTTIHAVGAFKVSWDGFKITRPQLLFVPIEDKGDVSFDLRFAGAQ